MSSEKDRAQELFEQRFNDDDEWGEGEIQEVVPDGPRRRLSAMVSVRLTPEELALIQKSASTAGISVSAFLRAVALANIKPSDPLSSWVDGNGQWSFHGAVGFLTLGSKKFGAVEPHGRCLYDVSRNSTSSSASGH